MKTPDIAVAIDSPAQTRNDKVKKIEEDAPATFETAISACGYGKFHYILMLGLMPMCAAQLFSSGSVSFAIPTAQCDLHLDDFQKGTLNAATYLGNIAVGLVWGGVSDVFGRRRIIAVCFLLDFIVSLACGFAHSYWLLLVLKVLAGTIISGPNAVIFAYLAETHDDAHRGPAIMANGLSFAFSQVIQPALAYFLLPLDFRITLVEGVLSLTAWRVFLLLCAVPSLISGLYFLSLPESPKFLMSKGRYEEALGVFRRVYAMNTGRPADTYPVKSLEVVAPTAPAKGQEGAAVKESGWRSALKQFRPLFHKQYASRILLLVVLQINIMLCINSLRLWTPQLFALMEQYERVVWSDKPSASTACQMISATLLANNPIAAGGGANTTTAVVTAVSSRAGPVCHAVSADVYMRSIIINSVSTGAFVISGWAIKKLGNRPILLSSFPLALLSGMAMLWAPSADVFMGLLAAFSPLSAIGLTSMSTITVDIFPTSLRGLTVSITLISGRIASLSGNLILPVLLNISCEAVFIFLAVCMAICSVLVWFLPTNKASPDNN